MKSPASRPALGLGGGALDGTSVCPTGPSGGSRPGSAGPSPRGTTPRARGRVPSPWESGVGGPRAPGDGWGSPTPVGVCGASTAALGAGRGCHSGPESPGCGLDPRPRERPVLSSSRPLPRTALEQSGGGRAGAGRGFGVAVGPGAAAAIARRERRTESAAPVSPAGRGRPDRRAPPRAAPPPAQARPSPPRIAPVAEGVHS